MKKINLIVMIILIGLLSVMHTSQTVAQNPEMKECWHGTINSPFDDFLGIVPASQQCPTHPHPTILFATEEEHIEGDPNCQTSELNPFE